METKIHYIGQEWKTKFIIAKTKCGEHWENINEFTDDKKIVTCKKCLQQLKISDNQELIAKFQNWIKNNNFEPKTDEEQKEFDKVNKQYKSLFLQNL